MFIYYGSILNNNFIECKALLAKIAYLSNGIGQTLEKTIQLCFICKDDFGKNRLK